MKDIVLINANYVKAEKNYNVNFHLAVQRYPPIHLAYLASSLEETNVSVAIIDAAALNLSDEETIKLLKKYSPKFVGIHVNSFFLPIVYNLIQKIRSSMDCTIIVGGPHIAYQPYSVIKLGADFGFAGESENALKKFVKGHPKDEISGLIYKNSNRVIINKTEYIKNLDSLPFPARHLLPNEKYYNPYFKGKTTTMVTSRGCPFDCIFCANVIKRKYRELSAERVIEEIENIVNMKFEYILIKDDIFSYNKKRVEKICKEMIKRKLNINWGCETRADSLDRETISLMKRAGCTNVQFGVESGSERVRNEIIRKNLSTSAIKKTAKNLKEVGIESSAYFMFGHPSETYDEMKQTLRFAMSLNLNYAEFHLSVPIPGSELFEIACKEGRIKENIWDDIILGEQIPIYVPDNVTLEQMVELQKKAYTKFYFRTPVFIKVLKKIKSFNDFYSKIKTGLILLKNKCV